VLDHARANYAVQVDGSGNVKIKDIGVGDASNGQSITVSGASYIVFNGAATDASGAYSNIYFLANSQNSQVAELYAAAFGRQPDLSGLEYWENQLGSGYALDRIAGNFVSSDEFKAKFAAAAAPSDLGGVNDQAFITALYQNVLHRTPDAAGLNYWIGDMAGGDPRGKVLINFAISAENVANTNVVAGHSGNWLINTGKGGYADVAGHTAAEVVLVGVNGHLDAHAV
jgi:hypothetical protein